jgi:fumarate reductase flavoprotein subunit
VEILVFGHKAARSALEYARSAGSGNDAALAAQAEAAQAKLRALFLRNPGKESIAGLRKEMMDTMEEGAGIYRTQEGLAKTCAKIAELRRRYGDVALHDKTNVYNTDLLSALELGSMLDCAEAVAVGARERKESRGAHQRLDFTARDDANYLKHTMTYYNGFEPPRVDYRDVVITTSPPGVRDYSGGGK